MGLKMFTNNYQEDDSDILKELEKVKNGEPLPRGGIFDILYDCVTYAGQTVVLRGKKNPVVIRVEHDDIIMDLRMDEYTWDLESDDTIVSMVLLIKDSVSYNTISFTFNKKDKDAFNTFKSIRSRKKLDVCFLSMLYGEIVKAEYRTFNIPKAVVSRM